MKLQNILFCVLLLSFTFIQAKKIKQCDTSVTSADNGFQISGSSAQAIVTSEGYFFSCQPDGTMQFNRPWFLAWEEFQITQLSGGLYSVLSLAFGTYLTITGSNFDCSASDVGPNQQLKITSDQGGITISLPSNGMYGSSANMNLGTLATSVGQNEIFYPPFVNYAPLSTISFIPGSFCLNSDCSQIDLQFADGQYVETNNNVGSSKTIFNIVGYVGNYITLQNDIYYYSINPDLTIQFFTQNPYKFSYFRVLSLDSKTIALQGFGNLYVCEGSDGLELSETLEDNCKLS